ncbi:MAG: (2Fe-2S)-binding protein, partial [Candidatus Thermofonsia Clade 3 bacterium]
MNIHLTLNGVSRTLACEPGETLLSVLRRNGVWS